MKKHLPKIIFLVICFVVFDLFLNLTLYNPSFITPIYDFALKHKMLNKEELHYPNVNIRNLNLGFFPGPRALVTGKVQDIVRSSDGDIHMNITSLDGTMVTEIIPEYPLLLPSVGDKIRIWGITRYDIDHRWWELHPVIGWEKIKS